MATGTYDADDDLAYVYVAPHIGDGEAAEQLVLRRPDGDLVLDFDRDGRLLGIEILGARALLTPETLSSLAR